MKRLLPLAVSAALTACTCGPGVEGGAHRVIVRVDSALKADCVELQVSEAGGPVLASQMLTREASRATYTIGVLRDALPATVTYTAVGFLGTCTNRTSLKLNGTSAPVEATFPASGVNEVTVALDPPGATLDADRDGYVDLAQQGTDCDDADALVNPAAPEVCSSGKDSDCNGKVGCEDDACISEPVCMRPASKLAFVNPVRAVTVFDCSEELTIESQDFQGPAAVSALTAVSLTADQSGVTFYSDATCATPITSVDIAYGQTTARVFLKATQTGTPTVTAAATGLNSGTQVVTVQPQVVSQVAFATPQRTVRAGDCMTDVVTLEARDSQGRPTPTLSDLTVTLEAAPTMGAAFFDAADATCTTALGPAQVTISSGTTSVSFRMRATQAGTTVLTARPSGLTAVTQDLTVTAGAPTAIGFSGNANAQVNTCSAAPTQVVLRDAFGNPAAAAANETVTLDTTSAPSGGTLQYATAAGCGSTVTQVTIPMGQSSVQLWVQAGVVGAYTMRAQWNAQAGTATANIVAGPPDHLAFTTAAVSARAGECAPLPSTVQAQDNSNNPSGVTAPTAVTLTSTHAVQFFSDAACATALPGGNTITLATGTTDATFYFRADVANPSFQMSAAATGLTGASRSGYAITPALPNRLQWNPATTAVTSTAGACSPALRLDVLDAFGNATSFGSATTLAMVPAPAGVTFSTSSSCTSPGASLPLGATATTLTFYALANTAQTYALSGSASGRNTSTPNAALQVDPAAADRLVYAPTPPASAAAGACTTFTVVRRDPFGNAAPVTVNTSVTLAAAPATGFTFYANTTDCGAQANAVSTVTMPNGSSTTSFVVRGTVVGSAAVSASVGGLTPASANLAITAGAVSRLVFTPALPANVTAGACTATTVQRQDAFGNPVTVSGNTPVTLAAAGAASSAFAFYASSADCLGQTGATTSLTMLASQSSVAVQVRGTLAGAVTLTASQTGVGTNATANVTVDPAAATKLVYTPAITSPVIAGACTPVTVQRRDTFDNPVPVGASTPVTLTSAPSTGVTFYANAPDCAGLTSAVTQVTMAMGNTQVGFMLRSTVTGSHTITAAQTGVATNAAQAVQVDPAAADSLVYTPTPAATVTAGACTSVTVTRRDLYGNDAPVSSGTPVTLAATGAAGAGVSFYANNATCGAGTSPVGQVTMAGSSATATFFVKGTTAGAATMTASQTGVPTSAVHAFTVDPGATAVLVILGSGSTVAAGACGTPLTVERRDALGNPTSPATPLVVDLSSDAASGLVFSAGAGCSGSATQVTIAASASQATFSFRPSVAETVTLTASSTGLTDGTQQWTVTAGTAAKLVWKTAPPASLPSGTCADAVIEAQDAFDNPAPVSAAVTVNLASSNAAVGMTFHPGAGCGAGATLSVSIPMAASQVTLSLQGTTAGSTDVTGADAAMVLTATPPATVTVAGPKLELSTLASTTLETGACVLVAVERLDSADNPLTSGALAVSLSSSAASFAEVYSDPACTSTATGVTIMDGFSVGAFWVKALTAAAAGSAATITATAGGFTDGTLGLTVLPLVRRGTCDMAAGATTSACAVTPAIPSDDISRTFLVFQAVNNDPAPQSASAACHLTTTSGVRVECQRSGSTGAVSIAWQTVSFANDFASGGASVQHLSGTLAAAATSPAQITIPTAVDTSQTFILFSHNSQGGTLTDHTDFLTATLTSSTAFDVQQDTAIATFENQMAWFAEVVQLAGASVARGTTTVTPTDGLVNTATQASDTARAFLLYSVSSGDGADATYECKRRARGEITNATTLTFHRAVASTVPGPCADSTLTVKWERVNLRSGDGTEQNTDSMANNSASATRTLSTSVDPSRTVVFSGGQGFGGQTAGEGDHTGGGNRDKVGIMHGTVVLNAAGTQYTVTRNPSNGAASFTIFTATFAP